MKLRTDKQIKAQIKKIKQERKTIRQFSSFGDNNWEKMDEEIQTLQDYLEGELDISDFGDILENLEAEMEPDKFMECGKKAAIDFIEGY